MLFSRFKIIIILFNILDDNKISPELQAADLDLIDSKVCDELLSKHHSRNWCGLWENQFCAGKLEGGVDSCQVYVNCSCRKSGIVVADNLQVPHKNYTALLKTSKCTLKHSYGLLKIK